MRVYILSSAKYHRASEHLRIWHVVKMSLTVHFSTCDLKDIMRLKLNSTSKFKQIKCTNVHSYCQQDKEYFKLQEVKGLK